MSEQGEFARGYVRALASAAGLRVSVHEVHRDGVDVGLRYPATVSPALEAQVGWALRPGGDSAEWWFDGLDEERFNRLVGDDFTVPRYLFLLVLPENGRYTDFESDGMFLRHLGYFHSLRNESPVAGGARHRVRVPKANVLTVPRLRMLLRGAL